MSVHQLLPWPMTSTHSRLLIVIESLAVLCNKLKSMLSIFQPSHKNEAEVRGSLLEGRGRYIEGCQGSQSSLR